MLCIFDVMMYISLFIKYFCKHKKLNHVMIFCIVKWCYEQKNVKFFLLKNRKIFYWFLNFATSLKFHFRFFKFFLEVWCVCFQSRNISKFVSIETHVSFVLFMIVVNHKTYLSFYLFSCKIYFVNKKLVILYCTPS